MTLEKLQGIFRPGSATKWGKVEEGELLTGISFHSVDPKNRLIIPSKLREAVDEEKEGTGFYITRGLDECLFLFTPLRYQEVASRLESASFTTAKARAFQRLFFSSAEKVFPDKQGRILLPVPLMKSARISREVAIVGVHTRIEIWDKKLWEEFEKRTSPEYEAFAEEIFS